MSVPEVSSPPLSSRTSPSSVVATSPSHPSLGITGTPPNDKHHPYQLKAITGVGIGVTVISFTLLLVLVFLIRKKSKELDDSETGFTNTTFGAPFGRSGRKTQDGMIISQFIICFFFSKYLCLCFAHCDMIMVDFRLF